MKQVTIALFLIFLIVLVGVGGFLLLNNKATKPQPITETTRVKAVSISGVINLNGVAPAGRTFSLAKRQAGSQQTFEIFATGVPAADKAVWRLEGVRPGESYEIQAILQGNDQTTMYSDPIFVSAPAAGEELTLDIGTPVASTKTAIISGTVGLNGYIPEEATITIQGKQFGKGDFTTIAKGILAKDKQVVTYTSAIEGKTYEIIGLLLDRNGEEIGRSKTLIVDAPANDEALDINSTATPPPTPTPKAVTKTPPPPAMAAISGKIDFNGAAPSNSRIVIFQRIQGSNDYKVAVDNISPTDGTKWEWKESNIGIHYELIAILKQKQSNNTDKDITTSNVLTVAAPASDEKFTINSGFAYSAPSGSITVTCGNRDGTSNTWGATVAFQSVPDAQSYWFQIGTTNGGTELLNSTQNASSNTAQTVSATMKDGVIYYARYAFAAVTNVNAFNKQFSAPSSTTSIRCAQ